MIVLTEHFDREHLFPFTHTRHTADIFIGAMTIRKKWELLTGDVITTDDNENGIFIAANIIPTLENYIEIIEKSSEQTQIKLSERIKIFDYSWQIFQLNDYALKQDYLLLTERRVSQPINNSIKATNVKDIFFEEGVNVAHCFLNAANGPIYVSRDAVIMEGSMIRGPFFLGEGSVVKMGTKIYGATSIGKHCTVGGEIKNSVMFANSNKAHDGYLGDSVIGEWCNLGAGTSNSNVKNTATQVGYKLKDNTALTYSGNKGGLLMGDYSRSAINTSFNTGAVIGVCCNIFGEKNSISFKENFTWGNEKYIFEKALRDIENWMAFKNTCLTENIKRNLKQLYEKV
jgi:UDP-N-acetylglucosamine diphosphorylase/glucosamine-1-phosphate N-acetyltransferase